MGKIVMPKNSAVLDEMEAVLRIYYEEKDWLQNDVYKDKLKELIGPDQYSSSYTKKSQITSYFGFTEWQDLTSSRSRRRITQSGIRFYQALRDKDKNKMIEELITAMEKQKFGRDNCGVFESDSDVEPPAVFIRASLDLGYLTYKEFAYLLWVLEDRGGNYSDAIREIRFSRKEDSLNIPDGAQKYIDAKPITILLRWGLLVELAGITGPKRMAVSPLVIGKYKNRLLNLKVYNIDMNINPSQEEVRRLDANRLVGGKNILLYGVPGSGKSYTVKKEYCDDLLKIERVVFHPDYTYSDFVGQILPKVALDGKITYEFTPGPFAKILNKSYKDPQNMYYMIIEEVNRGNAPAIFGEVFQLLDRDENGNSEYAISNEEVSKLVYGDGEMLVRLPSNLNIVATMNTSDQNVFTLDTAFQRRWNMRMIENNIKIAEHANYYILDTPVKWGKFNTVINGQILENSVSVSSVEDKRLGAYFVGPRDLKFDDSEDLEDVDVVIRKKALSNNHLFAENVIKYLWDDAFKFSRQAIFSDQYRSLEDVVRKFNTSRGIERFGIFKPEIVELLV